MNFRAVSLSLFGTQEEQLYVRLLTACEMIENEDAYDVNSTNCVLKDDRVLTSPYKDLVTAIISEGEYAELIHLYAISAAFDVCLQSYVPPSTAIGMASSPYTVVVHGRGVRRTAAPKLTLMWTVSALPTALDAFRPNHIVLLVDRSAESQPIVELNDSDATDDYDESPDAAEDGGSATSEAPATWTGKYNTCIFKLSYLLTIN